MTAFNDALVDFNDTVVFFNGGEDPPPDPPTGTKGPGVVVRVA